MSPALLVLHVVGALIAWFAPNDALTRWPFLKIVVADVGEILPLLPDAIEKSKFPGVTALYFSLMLAATPLRLWVAVRCTYSYRIRIEREYCEFSLARKACLIALVSVLACIGLFFCRRLFLRVEFLGDKPVANSAWRDRAVVCRRSIHCGCCYGLCY
ncbi:hypothetical protein [Burkholderia multivorans]|nr:hypothetical protein [Burkholderia multivorans]